jgi:hypothetical protein
LEEDNAVVVNPAEAVIASNVVAHNVSAKDYNVSVWSSIGCCSFGAVEATEDGEFFVNEERSSVWSDVRTVSDPYFAASVGCEKGVVKTRVSVCPSGTVSGTCGVDVNVYLSTEAEAKD